MMKHLVCTVYSFTGKSLIVLTSQVLKITLSIILKKNKFWSFGKSVILAKVSILAKLSFSVIAKPRGPLAASLPVVR